MESMQIVCWKCGFKVSDSRLPVSREQRCSQCFSDLHVCKLCEFFNPDISDHCDAEVSDTPREIDRANFCDEFRPRANAYSDSGPSAADEAKRKLNELFGGASDSDSSTNKSDNASELEKLFGMDKKED